MTAAYLGPTRAKAKADDQAVKDASTLIAEAALLKAPVYRLQPPGPAFLACYAGATRELADVAMLRAFVDQLRGRRG